MTMAPLPLVLSGRGEARDEKRTAFAPRPGAEAALAAIRYADPASWTTATAVARALGAQRDAVLLAHDRVGVIVTSADGPVEAMAAMEEAARSGSSSPIRFPASNAGSLAGIPSIAFTFRGPTLMLTLPAARGVPVALLLAEAWLRRGQAEHVVVAAAGRVAGKPAARCLLLAAPGAPGVALDRDGDVAWLVAEGG
jgi:3-oxoacyl-(acyl-carrier-protein) synthase